MHPIYDDLYFTVALILLTPIDIIFLFAVVVWCLVDLVKRTPIKYKAVKFSVIAVCLAGLLYVLPFGFHWLALRVGGTDEAPLSEKDKTQIVKYSKLAVQTAVLPSVKSYMYYNLGSQYHWMFEGSKAIEAYEKSKEYKGITDNSYNANIHLCILYTIKGDFANGVKSCTDAGLYQSVAVNYILQDNYTEALNQINKKFASPKRKNCSDYMTRGFIYKKLNQPDKAQKDFEQARSLPCQKDKIEAVSTNENYYKELNAQRPFKF